MAQPVFTLRTADGSLDESTVVRFTGTEAISGLYAFEITVKIPDSVTVDLDAALRADATFVIEFDGRRYPRHGVLREFEMRHSAAGYSYYVASLVPRLWNLSLYPTNEVFVGPDFMTVDAILDAVLTRGGFSSGSDFDLSALTAAYPERQYTCQFGETDFAFLSRQMERDGIWYRFEQGADAETLVMQDDANYPALDIDTVTFAADPDDNNRYRTVHGWVCRKQRLPNEVVLRDFSYAQPSLDVSGSAVVDPDGMGSAFIYGENFETKEEGERLAAVRAEELRSRRTLFHGQGAVPGFAAGGTFTLTGHPGQKGAWNDRQYLLVAVTHEGENPDNTAGAPAKNAPRYANTFTAIPADVQFRPERVTPKPRFDGTMTAIVYAENAASKLAEVNETGHYRVRLPFDRAGADGEKASHWIRMAQPYAGADQGMYFPLKANTEVLLTFINGDPDRPVIAGAVPNGANVSLLNSETANQATIATPDLLKTTAAGGAYRNVATVRYMKKKFGGGTVPPTEPLFNEIDAMSGEKVAEMSVSEEVGGQFFVERAYGDTYRYAEGSKFSWGSENTFNFGNDYEELHGAINYVGEDAGDPKTRYQFSQYDGSDCVDDPGREVFDIPILGRAREKQEGLIEKNWGNKMEYHYGASYNWAGGYGPGGSRPEYNYGNSYVENLHEVSRGTFDSQYGSTKHDSYKGKIDPAKSSIEKTYGDTYSYQHGYNYEVHEGDSKEEIWGSSDATVHGDSSEMVYGDVKSIVHGSTNDMLLGGSNAMQLGGANEMFVGGKNEMCISVGNNIALSAENNMWFGAKTDISVGAVFEMTAGTKIELGLATVIEAESVAELRTKVTAIETAITEIGNIGIMIKSAPTVISNGAMSLNLSALKFW
ncbi:MAG TPA: type VI secretion system tip protein TssI/VgrG [Gammaproteobacteria bacterium]